MSHLSKFANGKKITAGMQIVKVILTQCHDGNAANLLRAIAKSHHGSRMQRSFPEDWQENHGIFEKSGLVTFDGREFPITLKIGASDEEVLPETLVIKDSHGSCCSMKTENGKMVLEIGSTIAPRRIESLASQITGTWIVHGENWRNRANIPFMKPWGDIKKGVYETFSFEVIDGSYENPRPTLRELIHRGCRRSTHVGQWYQRHSTIIPAIVGMPMTMHEFKKEGGVDICMFNGLEIGKNSGTLPLATLWAKPSTIAVFPTPASPISTGLFFVLREIICIKRLISLSLPIIGSILPAAAMSVKFLVYFSIT